MFRTLLIFGRETLAIIFYRKDRIITVADVTDLRTPNIFGIYLEGRRGKLDTDPWCRFGT